MGVLWSERGREERCFPSPPPLLLCSSPSPALSLPPSLHTHIHPCSFIYRCPLTHSLKGPRDKRQTLPQLLATWKTAIRLGRINRNECMLPTLPPSLSLSLSLSLSFSTRPSFSLPYFDNCCRAQYLGSARVGDDYLLPPFLPSLSACHFLIPLLPSFHFFCSLPLLGPLFPSTLFQLRLEDRVWRLWGSARFCRLLTGELTDAR